MSALWRLGIGAIGDHRWAFVAQVLALAIGLAVLAAVLTLARELGSSPIAGAPCAGELYALALHSEDNEFSDRFTFAQSRILADGMTQGLPLRAARLTMKTAGQNRTASFVDPELLSALCVKVAEGPGMTREARGPVGAVLLPASAPAKEIAIGSLTAPVVGRFVEFTGVGRTSDDIAWLPWWAAAPAGIDIERVDAALLRVFVRPRAGVSRGALARELETLRQANPGVFADAHRIELTQNLVIGGATANRLQSFVGLVSTLTAALLALLVFIMAIFQVGRHSALARTVAVARSVGAPHRFVGALASFEPVATGLSAALASAALTPLVFRAFDALLSGTSPSGAASSGPAVAAIAGGALVVTVTLAALRYALTRRTTLNEASFVQRVLARGRVHILAFQIAIGVLALATAIAVIGAFVASVPRAVLLKLDGLSVAQLSGPEAHPHPTFAVTAAALVDDIGARTATQIALSASELPIAAESYETALADVEGRKSEVFVARVTPNFFTVTGLVLHDGPGLSLAAANTTGPEPTEVVVNRRFIDAMYGGKLPSDASIAVQTLYTGRKREPVIARIVGWVDEGSSGTEAKTAQLRLQPMVYFALTRVDPDLRTVVAWIRGDNAPAALRELATPLMGGAMASRHQPAAELVAGAVRRERAMAVLFGIGAAGVLALAALGVMALAALHAAQSAKQLAIAYAVGASRLRIARQFATPSAAAIALAVAGAVVLGLALEPLVATFNVEVAAQWPLACGVAGAVLLVVALAALAKEVVGVYRIPVLDLLRGAGET